MCGRFSLTVSAETLIQHFQLKNGLYMVPRYNIAPAQMVPILKLPGIIDFLHWGFVATWMKEKEGRGFINARSETIQEKPSFREAFRKRRCLVVADGYYEWKSEGKVKQPYYIRRIDRSVFAFAGIWENDTCAILTTTAMDTRFLEIHQRMPVILPSSAYLSWLNPTAHLKQVIEPLLFPVQHDSFEIYPVSVKVNNPIFEDPDCIILKNT